ncbi:cytochrome P450 [Amycolatopsis sp. cg5]|uniref:cytochrome P450 n=1 Tax=Amycolatopsis sp. cg5 TaxID=3238802 RepID=UPI0035244436
MTEVVTQFEATGTEQPPLFPMKRPCPFKMPEEYARLRAEEPVSKVTLRVSGKQVWIITKADDVRKVLTDSTLSSNWKEPGYPLPVAVPDDILQAMELPLVAMDPPHHTVRRRMLIPEFTAKRMQALRPKIEKIVHEHIDAMLAKGGPVDLVEELAVPVPSLVFCELLGVPASETSFFRNYAELTTNREVTPMEIGMAQQEMEAYLDKLVTDRGVNPKDDLLTRLVARNNEEGNLAHSDVVALARVLLFGGFDTIANVVSLGTVALLQNPDQLQLLKDDPTLTANAVGELLRFASISDHATARVLPHDITVSGVTIPAGDGIIALNGSANRDEERWENPDMLDVCRDTKGHASFGHGIHQCPGASLVKVELEIIFNALFSRIPGLRLHGEVPDSAYKHDALIFGMYELPVTW